MAEENNRDHMNDAKDPSADAPYGLDEDDTNLSSPPTGQVRIAAVEAAVAAGLAPSTSRNDATPPPNEPEDFSFEDFNPVVELPAWTDEPTGQVPRVLLDDNALEDDTNLGTRGPSWRQDSADWDEPIDLSIFAPEVDEEELDTDRIAGQGVDEIDNDHPFSFGDLGLDGDAAIEDAAQDDEAWATVLGEPEADEPGDEYGLASFGPQRLGGEGRRNRRRRGGAHRAHTRTESEVAPKRQRRQRAVREAVISEQPVAKKDGAAATITGLIAAAVAIVCFFLGALPSLVLVTVGVTLAAGEVFAVLRRVGFRPATLPGLIVVAGLSIGAYLRGTAAIPFVLAAGLMAIAAFYLSGKEERPVINLSATFGVVCWVGVLGSFASLLLAPSLHPHKHGIALVVGAIVITVAHDLGSYLIGGRLGRHPLAPAVSPNKTVEGLIGGTVLAFIVAALVVVHIHPFTMSIALELGIVVAVFAPLGDLVESLLKRDLGVKDMGNLLPGHGGVLDRVDAMLFVLPATFYLASLHHFV